MTTSRMRIKLGTEFSITLPNGREKDFEVENLHQQDADGNPIVFDGLKCRITNSTSWSPPVAHITDDVNHIIKIKFTDSTIPITTALTLLVQGCVSTVQVEQVTKVLLDGEKLKESITTGATDLLSYVKKSAWLFIGASVFLFFISGSTFGDWLLKAWSNLNAGKVIQASQEMDTRILTNKHDVYDTAAFTRINALYKMNHGNDADLSKAYNFVGNGTFLVKDLIKENDGSLLLLDHGDAKSHCKGLGGRLPEVEELSAYLAGKYLTVENPVWPIRLYENVPEWTLNNVDWDNYWLYTKIANVIQDEYGKATGINNSYRIENIDDGLVKIIQYGYRIVEVDDGEKFAFRCAFTEDFYIRGQ